MGRRDERKLSGCGKSRRGTGQRSCGQILDLSALHMGNGGPATPKMKMPRFIA